MRHFVPLFVILLFCGCTTDISKDPSRRTNYVVGATYELKVTGYLSGGYLHNKRVRIAGASEGVLPPATRLVVRKVTYYHLNPETGPYTSVYAEILTGEHTGHTVEISFFTGSSFAFVRQDPELIDRVK